MYICNKHNKQTLNNNILPHYNNKPASNSIEIHPQICLPQPPHKVASKQHKEAKLRPFPFPLPLPIVVDWSSCVVVVVVTVVCLREKEVCGCNF